MTSWYKSGEFETPASGQTVVPVTAKGNDPKAVHFFGGGATLNQTIQADAQQWHGLAAEAGPDSHHNHHGESNATPNTQRFSSNTASIVIRDPSDDSLLVEGTVTFQATSFTVTYTTFTAGQRVNYECWGGDDVSAIVREMTAASSPHVGVGFAPEFLLFTTAGQQIPANSIHAYQSWGCAHDNGVSIDQWCLFSYMGDNDLDTIGSALAAGDCCGQYDVDFASWQIQVTSFDADGFTWAGTNADEMTVLCLSFGGVTGVDVGTFTKSIAAAPAAQNLPDLGFIPSGYYLCTATRPSELINVNQDCVTAHGTHDGSEEASYLTTTDNVTSTDRHERGSDAHVLVGSKNLNVDGVQFAGDPTVPLDSSTPEIIWDPNTADADVIGYYAFETFENLIIQVVNETVEVNENVVIARALNRVVSEVVEIPETVVRSRALNRIVNELVEIGEVVEAVRGLVRVVGDTVEIVEQTNVVRGLIRVADDTVEIGEVIARARALNRIVSETVEIGEVVARARSLNRVVDEVVEIGENVVFCRALNRVVDDTVEIGEQTNVVRGLIRVVDETVEIGEQTNIVRGLIRVVDETVEIGENVEIAIGMVRVVDETVEIGENVNTARAFVQVVNETVEIVENAQFCRGLVRVIDETVEVGEEVNIARAFVQVITETVEIGEVVEFVRGLVRVIDETVEIGETVVELVALADVFCTSGVWSSEISFAPCDSYRIEIDGPGADNVKVSATLEFEEDE